MIVRVHTEPNNLDHLLDEPRDEVAYRVGLLHGLQAARLAGNDADIEQIEQLARRRFTASLTAWMTGGRK